MDELSRQASTEIKRTQALEWNVTEWHISHLHTSGSTEPWQSSNSNNNRYITGQHKHSKYQTTIPSHSSFSSQLIASVLVPVSTSRGKPGSSGSCGGPHRSRPAAAYRIQRRPRNATLAIEKLPETLFRMLCQYWCPRAVVFEKHPLP